MARRGRRPGDPGTRQAILDAARALFVEVGFNKATMAEVARRAGVDGALVYHYFGSKIDLFIESTVRVPVPGGLSARPPGYVSKGSDVVAHFLQHWEEGPEAPGQAFVALAQAASGSAAAAKSLQEFVTERIWGGNLSGEAAKRASMTGTLLIGIAWARYVLQLGPVATASREEVAAWFGPTIDGLRAGDDGLVIDHGPPRQEPSIPAASSD